MSFDDDLATIRQQEQQLHFTSFNADTAWAVCAQLRADAAARGAAMTFEVAIAGRTLALATTVGASASQLDWVRRKRNTVMRFGHASYALGLELEQSGKTLEDRHGLTLAEYAMHGGGFPIALAGTGCIGSVVVSGLHQRVDHAMVVSALAHVLGVSVAALPA